MLVACTTCGRHHRDTDATCPFCTARPSGTTLRNTAAAVALGLTVGCGSFGVAQPEYGVTVVLPPETGETGDTSDTAVADTGTPTSSDGR